MCSTCFSCVDGYGLCGDSKAAVVIAVSGYSNSTRIGPLSALFSKMFYKFVAVNHKFGYGFFDFDQQLYYINDFNPFVTMNPQVQKFTK